VVTEANLVSEFINVFNQVIDSSTLEARPARLAFQWTGRVPRLDRAGSPGHSHVTEASTNLNDWMAIATNRLATPSTNEFNLGSAGHPSKFYRARNWR
jgi:hypothetical protein